MKFLAILLTFISWVQAISVIDYPRQDGDYGTLRIGDVRITNGNFWSIFRNRYTTLFGSIAIENNAGLYVSSEGGTGGLRVSVSGILSSITNQGVILFESVQSMSAFFYDVVASQIHNTGEIFLGGESNQAPEVAISANQLVNNGLISIYQRSQRLGRAYVGRSGLDVNNNGAICLYNFLWEQQTSVSGSGCIRVQEKGVAYISNPLLQVKQTISLDTPSSAIRVRGIKSSDALVVAGYGNGNLLSSDKRITNWEYNASTGIVTIYTDFLRFISVKFNIGKGYDKTQFKLDSVSFGRFTPSNNVLRYMGAVPSGANSAAHCRPCAREPAQPDSGHDAFPGTEFDCSEEFEESQYVTQSEIEHVKHPNPTQATQFPTIDPELECEDEEVASTVHGDSSPNTEQIAVPTKDANESGFLAATSSVESPVFSDSSASTPAEYDELECSDYGEKQEAFTGFAPTTDNIFPVPTSKSSSPISIESISWLDDLDCSEEDIQPTLLPENPVVTTTYATNGWPETASAHEIPGEPSPSRKESSLSLDADEWDCDEYDTWTTTGATAQPTINPGAVDSSTPDKQWQATSSIVPSWAPVPSELPDCPEEYDTWTTTGADGQPTVNSGKVDVTTGPGGELLTTLSVVPSRLPSPTELPDCPDDYDTWTVVGSDGTPTTLAGIVDVTTGADGMLTTTSSALPIAPQGTDELDCDDEAGTTTDANGKPVVPTGYVDVTSIPDAMATSKLPEVQPLPQHTELPDCPDEMETWTTHGDDGLPTAFSGVVDVTTNPHGGLVTLTVTYPSGSGSPTVNGATTMVTSRSVSSSRVPTSYSASTSVHVPSPTENGQCVTIVTATVTPTVYIYMTPVEP
ncbi:hypothetical protein DICA3_F38886 [Diutina catenulata]